MGNIDKEVVEDFGKEWSEYDQSDLSSQQVKEAFNQYFSIFPFDKIDEKSVGFDMGCGSGRWADLVATRVGTLNCIDPSDKALSVAKDKLQRYDNINFLCSSVDEVKIPLNSQDFGYSLGVLHHVPDTEAGIRSCSKLLKQGAPFLLYLYYNLDNKPSWFRFIWKLSDVFRLFISSLPFGLKKPICNLISLIVYLPLARLAFIFEKIGLPHKNIPLSDYRNKKFYFMKTDALDRFGTKLEQRFSRLDIEKMLINCGFENIQFSEGTPYWVSIAYKK